MNHGVYIIQLSPVIPYTLWYTVCHHVTISHYLLRLWLDAELTTNHYLNQDDPVHFHELILLGTIHLSLYISIPSFMSCLLIPLTLSMFIGQPVYDQRDHHDPSKVEFIANCDISLMAPG